MITGPLNIQRLNNKGKKRGFYEDEGKFLSDLVEIHLNVKTTVFTRHKNGTNSLKLARLSKRRNPPPFGVTTETPLNLRLLPTYKILPDLFPLFPLNYRYRGERSYRIPSLLFYSSRSSGLLIHDDFLL